MGGGQQSSGGSDDFANLWNQGSSYANAPAFNWGALGKGIQSAGGAIAAGSNYPMSFSSPTPYSAPGEYAPAPNPALIPQRRDSNNELDRMIMEFLQKAVRDVDPRAKEVHAPLEEIGLLPEGTKPSF